MGPQEYTFFYFLLEYKILSLLKNQGYFKVWVFFLWYNMNNKIAGLVLSNNSCGWGAQFELHWIIPLYFFSWILNISSISSYDFLFFKYIFLSQYKISLYCDIAEALEFFIKWWINWVWNTISFTITQCLDSGKPSPRLKFLVIVPALLDCNKCHQVYRKSKQRNKVFSFAPSF